MIVVGALMALMLGAAAALVVVRMSSGPTTLDRVVALDMLVAIIVCGIGGYIAISRDATVVPVMLVVALLGFTGSVAIARIIGKDRI